MEMYTLRIGDVRYIADAIFFGDAILTTKTSGWGYTRKYSNKLFLYQKSRQIYY